MLATCAQVTLSFHWLAFAVKVTHHKKFYRECQPINTCARVASTEVYACHRGKNDFLTTWKLIFTTLEINFLPPWILIFTTVEIDFYRSGNCLPGKLRAYLTIIGWRGMWFGTSLVPRAGVRRPGFEASLEPRSRP